MMFKINWYKHQIQWATLVRFPSHERRFEGFVTATKYFWDSTIHRKMALYEGLTSSYVLIFINKVNLNALYKALYLSRSIRPNKWLKIDCKI